MDIHVNGKQIDVGEALSGHVRDRLEDGVLKYFQHPIDGEVTFSRVAHLVRVDASVHAGHGIFVRAHGEAEDPYISFDQALERIEKRLRRYKRRLQDHHVAQKASLEMVPAASYVLRGESEEAEEPDDPQPVIVAETETELPTVPVSAAVMRMDLADAPVLMFRNSAHGRLNVVYRRNDGNIGWIDPKVEADSGE
ncbi:MAG: ribosome-associated translation inhibitor RaiA [Alphaproteobacteria bacterium]|nr:ribosome-associated translation inhibitor RaiA [Alphaproteobacteria bacterium]